MKLFITTGAGEKIYLRLIAATRSELATQIGSPWFTINDRTYHVRDVKAETSNSTATGAVVGGMIGILLGPVGIIGGSLIGGLLGNESDKGETQAVNYFNSSPS